VRPSPVHGVLYGGSQAHTLSGNTTGSAGAARVLAATPPPPPPPPPRPPEMFPCLASVLHTRWVQVRPLWRPLSNL